MTLVSIPPNRGHEIHKRSICFAESFYLEMNVDNEMRRETPRKKTRYKEKKVKELKKFGKKII
jgi:hypothetical protein